MKARALRAPFVVGSLIPTASCLLLEPLDDVANESLRGGAGGEAGADAVSGGGGAGGAAGASPGGGGSVTDAAGAGGDLSAGEAGNGGTAEPVAERSGGAPSEAGAPSAGGSVSTGGTTGGGIASGGTTGGATTTGGMTGGMTGATDECISEHLCEGGMIDDFEGCGYPREEDQPADHKQTLGCQRPGEATPPEVHFICEPEQEGSEPCSVDWAVMPHPARAGSRVLCFFGTDADSGWPPFLTLYLRGNQQDYDVADASAVRFSYCSNEPLNTYLGCGPTNERCFIDVNTASATRSDDDDDPAACEAWKTLTFPLDLSSEERPTVRSLQLEIKTLDPGPFKLCIDDVEFVD